jgi:hypothetical protein
MTSNNTIDAARVELLLSELRLPAIKLMWAALAARADKEGWPAARLIFARRWRSSRPTLSNPLSMVAFPAASVSPVAGASDPKARRNCASQMARG